MAARARRQAVREWAAGMFAQGRPSGQIAAELRVRATSVRRWRRAWNAGGVAALASRGPGGMDGKLSDAQRQRLAVVLDEGPAVHGWADQRWILARVVRVIGRLFGVDDALRGVSYLLHRMGYSVQTPAWRAVQRDEAAVVCWQRQRWPAVQG